MFRLTISARLQTLHIKTLRSEPGVLSLRDASSTERAASWTRQLIGSGRRSNEASAPTCLDPSSRYRDVLSEILLWPRERG